jgi:PAS domain S-box-containing protein
MSSRPGNAVDDRSTQLGRMLVSAFLENIPDFIFFKDRQSRFIALSNSLVRYLGAASAAEVIGRTDHEFLEASHAQGTYEEEQHIIRTGQPVLGKVERRTRRDGQVSWALTHTLPLRDEAGEIIGTFGLSKDVTRTREMELALSTAQRELVDASRTAGMAEVANEVLHNVSNVLNSLNVSASIVATGLRQSKAATLAKIAALLREHQPDLVSFLSHDPKGKRVPEFLASLARHANEERQRLVQEVASLQKNIDHIKDIVSMQQTYATTSGVFEALDPVALVEDSFWVNASALLRHEVHVTREFEPVSAVLGEKAKVVQILVNLISNAKHACDASGLADKQVTLRIAPAPVAGRVRLSVQDNGIGIPEENITRIFAHGFTTRTNGHGFGLHSAANAARQMKGALLVHSDGVGKGATFTLELPTAPACP